MSKTEFLKKLAALLHILQEDEVRDILDEYEQHIDMKLAEGLSEAEAISAFGSVEELASEILSAYHVKADFKPKKENRVFEKMQDSSKKALDGAGNAVKTAGTKTGSLVKRIWEGMKNICKGPFVYVGGLINKCKARKEQNGVERLAIEKKNRSIGNKMEDLGRSIIHFCKGCIQFVIRCMFACIFACAGAVEIGLIICAGILFVLLGLGYPVIGFTIAVVGAVLSVFVITFYAAKHMRRKR